MRTTLAVLALLASPLAAHAQSASPPPEGAWIADPVAIDDEPPDERSFALRRPFALGPSFGIGTALDAPDAALFGFGIGVWGQLHENVAIGLSRITFGIGTSSIDGTLFSLAGTPFVEVGGFVDPHVQPYGRAGVLLHGRTETASQPGAFEVAAHLGGGVRFWILEWLTLGVELAIDVVLTDTLFLWSDTLRQGSVLGSATLDVGFHF